MSDDPTEAPLVQHHSAGGVVLRGRERETRVALMRSRYGTWVLPKGRLEAGETPEQAAVREIAEEVGLSGLALQAELGGTEHDFLLGDERPRKRVTWFLFLAPEEAEIRPDSAHGALDGGCCDALSVACSRARARLAAEYRRRASRSPGTKPLAAESNRRETEARGGGREV